MSEQTKGKISSDGRQVSDNLGHASDRGDAVSVPLAGPLAGKLSWLPPYDPKLDSKQLIPEDSEDPTRVEPVIPPLDLGQTIEEALAELEALPGWRSDGDQ